MKSFKNDQLISHDELHGCGSPEPLIDSEGKAVDVLSFLYVSLKFENLID